MPSFVRWTVVMASLALLAACRDDYEVKVIAAGTPAPSGWSTTAYRQLGADGKCIDTGGVVAFRRPASTVNDATRTCYEDDAGRAIAVPIRLPQDAWTRAGWHACSAAQSAAFDAACTAWAPHGVGKTAPAPSSALPADLLSMVHVPGGTFSMSDTERQNGVDVVVHPATSMTVAAFDLDATEVTATAYMACVKARACAPPRPEDAEDPLCTALRPGYELHPMTCVDWSQANAYCVAQHARLPTEIEWEYAARGGAANAHYPWGDAEPDRQLCWWKTQSGDETCRVASFPREALGTYDLAGNVGEWTATAEAVLSVDPTSKPKVGRVVRGGSFGTNARHGILLHSRESMTFHNGSVGFRCAR